MIAWLVIPAADARAQAAVRYLNPTGLPSSHGYSELVAVPPGYRLVFVSGQVPLDSAGRLVGAGDFRAQATQVFDNLQRALVAAGATFADVVELNFFVRDAGSNLPVLRDVRDRYISADNSPASTLVEVVSLFRPDVLLEVNAIAAVAR